MKQEKIISYRAGITRTPSDFLSREGELAECINLVTDHEELKVVVDPVEDGSVEDGARLLFVHSLAGRKNRIFLLDNALWCDSYDLDGERMAGFPAAIEDGTLPGTISGIQAVGKTLIVLTDEDTCYFLWKNGEYKKLTYPFPDLQFRAQMYTPERTISVTNSGKYDGIIDIDIDPYSTDRTKVYPKEGKQDEYNDLVLGLYAKNKKAVAAGGSFCLPFMVRAALELYDGSYTYITNPIVLFPSLGENTCGFLYKKSLVLETQALDLMLMQLTDYSDYSDLVKDVVVFASDGIEVHDTDQDQDIVRLYVKTSSERLWYGDCIAVNDPVDEAWGPNRIRTTVRTPTEEESSYSTFSCLRKRTERNIFRELQGTSVFYRICSLGTKDIRSYVNAREKMSDKTLVNLTTQPQLGKDDWYSRNRLIARQGYSYNSRLHLTDVRRGLFRGFTYFLPEDNVDKHWYNFYVKISTDGGDVWVMQTAYTEQRQGLYFFYPDTRARHVTIYRDTDYCVLDADLKEHPGLNGSYYMVDYLNTDAAPEPEVTVGADGFRLGTDTYDNNYLEDLPNFVLCSDVNNPFVFNASGYVTVGTGRVLGIASQTMALGQEEHGIHPLTVFTTKGLSALTLNSEGVYVRSDEFSREVCINPESITETDGAVFFVSKKGLMVVEGRQVRCMTGQMNGMVTDTAVMPGLSAAEMSSPANAARPWQTVVTPCQGTGTFLEFIRDSRLRIAYDYTDSRLLLINPSFGYAYSFGMADGAVTKVILPAAITNVVSDYPDNLMQDTQGTVWSLYGKPREDEVDVRKRAFLLSRPMKLSGPLTVTSLRELVNVGMWNRGNGSEVKTELWVSDDMLSWYPMSSRFGAAARYYRIALYVDMLPTERLSGTIVMEQERRTDNKRT